MTKNKKLIDLKHIKKVAGKMPPEMAMHKGVSGGPIDGQHAKERAKKVLGI